MWWQTIVRYRGERVKGKRSVAITATALAVAEVADASPPYPMSSISCDTDADAFLDMDHGSRTNMPKLRYQKNWLGHHIHLERCLTNTGMGT